ncbi:MAG: Bug family tripartite tricarboxylate transporter substrate binding protein [Burkholderiales bacterium]
MRSLITPRAWPSVLMAGMLAAGAVLAQSYPTRPIRLIVPFPPGNFSDGGARLAAQRLSDQLGQPVIVENRPGAGGTVGTEFVSRAAPDGYTLVLGTASTLTVAPHVFKERKYEPQRAFVAMSTILTMPLTFVVRAGLPVTTVQELAVYGRERPGILNFGSAGKGTQVHLSAEQFRQLAGVEATHVPFQGGAPALTALLAGNVDYVFDLPSSSAAHHRAGKLKILAITSRARLPLLPDVPTTAEAGMPELNVTAWMGVLAPTGVATEVVTRIDTAMRNALATKEMIAALENMGAMPLAAGPQEFTALIAREIASYADIVRRAGIQPD